MASESNGLDLSSDVVLQCLVDSYKSKRMERTSSQLTRQKEGRVYVNRSISMDKIKYIGFDMDHTLVVYKSPEYDILAYEMVVERLVSIGYPHEIQNIPYDSTFPVRGLFFDRYSGNLLKVDAFGNIMSAFHGFKSLSAREIREIYPNKYIQTSHERVFPLDTLFHIPETYLLAAVVDFFDSNTAYRKLVNGPECDMGVVCGDVTITYKMIQQDIRAAMHWVHTEGNLKQRTLNDLPRYVKKEPRLPLFLHRLRESGRKLFIATNSGYDYTQKVLSFMFDYPEESVPHQHWKNYFDYIIVDANKPLFFQEGTMLREVDEESGSLKLGMFTGGLKQGKIFSGGSSAAFCKYTGAKGKEVLYVGDHIFGDIIKSKKEQAFRTFLVIPELTSEIDSWEEHSGLFLRLQNLEFILAEMYHLGSESNGESQRESLPDIATIRMAMKETAQHIEESYPNQLGSLLRCGSRLTYFANQVSRFADLYSSACINLVNYPTNHLFSSPHQLMAHETPLSESIPLTPHSVNQLSRTPKRKVVGKLAQGLSVVDFDVDEEENVYPDSTGSKVPLAIVEEGQMDA